MSLLEMMKVSRGRPAISPAEFTKAGRFLLTEERVTLTEYGSGAVRARVLGDSLIMNPE